MDDRLYHALQQGATLVTAGNRLARMLREQYQARQRAGGAGVWSAPSILPWSAWMDALWEQRLYGCEPAAPPVRLNNLQERVLWEAAVQESGGLLETRAAAAAAQQAWALMHQWRLELIDVESQGGDDARAFAGWARRYSKDGWLEAARVPDALAAAMPPLPQRLLLAGFEEFTPQQRDFLAACPHVEEVAPGGELQGEAVRAAFPDGEQELAASAAWARALLDAGRHNIGVVLPRLERRRSAVARAFREAGVPVNISAGIPLARYPMVRCALAILQLQPERNEWTLASELLLARYLAGGETERTRRGLLDVDLRRRGQARVAAAALQHASCPVLARAVGRWLRVRQALGQWRRPSDWSRGFGLLLRALGWPGERALSSAEYQTVRAWSELLSEFATLDLVSEPLDHREAVALLARMAAEKQFQPETESAPVQVLGVLEASGLRFDHLWVAGMDDECWPGPSQPNPFLPIRLQRERGLPRCSPERELAYARRMTDVLLSSAPEVVVSHAVAGQDRELAPSPLILRLPPKEPADLRLTAVRPRREAVRESGRLETLEDHQGPPAPEGYQSGGANVFKHQAACPFRAFAELRLGAKALEEPVPGLDQRARGILVHKALETAWRRLRTHQALCACPDLDVVVRDAVAAALASLETPLLPAFAGLEQHRLETLVRDWFEIEKARTPFEVLEPESTRFVELGGIRCRVRLDRIDRLPDGREIVIDYKTGKPRHSDWEGDRPNDPQLPLYSVTHEGPPLAGVLFARVRNGESGFAGLVDPDVQIPGAQAADLTEVSTGWQQVLERLAADFRAGRADADPKNPGQNCRHCELAPLCRIAEYDCQEQE